MLTLILDELRDWATALLAAIPGRIGRLLRRLVYHAAFARSGLVISIGEQVEIACPRNISLGSEIYLVRGSALRACVAARITIGDRFAANSNARIIADNGGEIVIGNGVMVGPNVVIRASNHEAGRVEVPIWEQGQTGGRIAIGDDVWIGANAVIVTNVTIGSHVIVAAGAVVTHDVPDFAIVAGVPARVIADRRERANPSADRDAGS